MGEKKYKTGEKVCNYIFHRKVQPKYIMNSTTQEHIYLYIFVHINKPI